MGDRQEKLGFAPQKERIYNKLLPYAEKIDDESQKALAEIKGNLARSVAMRDIKIGATHWAGQLSRYIRLYGMKFSKEDHVALIKLIFELIIIPELELSIVQKFASQLIALLKKKELLSRDDLVLPWRPLYELLESVAYSQYEHHGLQLFPPNIENVLKNLVKHCRVYFSVESTQEMLDTWRPLLCPFDLINIKAVHYFEYFLPTNLPPSQHQHGFKLWFQEMIDMWDSYHNTPTWESGLVQLFSRLALDNIGYIDWSPYISKVFNRFLRSFNLPVGTQAVQVGRTNNTYEIFGTVTWIVSMLGGPNGSVVQDHIDKLFKALQTFYHPSNLGKWNIKLSGLLMTFPKSFVKRLHRERYKKPSWETPIPEDYRLSEDDVTRFVESMKPVVSMSMFSKYGSQDSAVALRHLSNMRPEIVIPDLLEKMYPAMENLTEPHRLIACMNCIVAVSRPMLRSQKWYPEGRSHVLPLLNLSLPGIDPNDFKKCLITFQLISTFVTLVPLVDCSEAVFTRNDLSEQEKELCSATAQFEDFVLQFLDRVFALIENSAQEHIHGDVTRLNPEQSMLDVGLASTFTSVLQQCSAPIFQAALRRLHNFVSNSVLENRVGGRFTANLCRAAAKVNAAEAVKTFLPLFCENIKEHIANHEELVNEEELDDSFLWNLLMLSQLVRCDGTVLLEYKDLLFETLTLVLHLKCVRGYEVAGQLLRFVLRALTLQYPLDYKSITESFDRPVSEYLAIHDWAAPGDIHNLGMKWHIPTKEELDYAQRILDSVLGSELDKIKAISPGKPMHREELLQRLNIILECLLGAGAVLPMWDGEAINLSELNIETQVPLARFDCNSSYVDMELTLNGNNARDEVVKAMKSQLSFMLENTEDDTKGLFKLIKIYETVLFFQGASKIDFDTRWKSFHSVKMALEDMMRSKKKHIRALLVDRVVLQMELRMLNSCSRVFTQKHKEVLLDLYTLSISHYGEVRKWAQSVLFQSFLNLPYSYRCLLDDLTKSLIQPDSPEQHFKVRKKAQEVLLHGFINLPYSYRCLTDGLVKSICDLSIPEHQFKGALYIISGDRKRVMATKRSWEVIGKIWPALVQAQHSEKPSILRVIDDIVSKVAKNMESPAIKIETSPGCIEACKCLTKSGAPSPAPGEITTADLEAGKKFEEMKNEKASRLYFQLSEDLVTLIRSGKLTWKFTQIGLEFLSLLLRHDIWMPKSAVELFTEFMIHDSLNIRKISTGSVSAILKQQKRKHPQITMDPYKESGTTPPSGGQFLPGNRKDNDWILYNSSDLPDTKEKWEKMKFVEKTHWGYYCWPKEMKVYADMSQQPKVDRSRAELEEAETPFYDKLMDPTFVVKFVDFLALEEHKGKDKFKNKHLSLFKGLFRNFGDTFLPNFKPKIEELLQDRSHDRHDTRNRCAMEIISGLLRGSKHWPYEKVTELYDWVTPLLRTSLDTITDETYQDWGTFYTVVSESRDPRKLYKLFELLLTNPIRGGASFEDSSRLFAVLNVIAQQEWRIPEIQHRLLNMLMPHLSHRYKNVRDRIGSLLCSIFMYDYQISPECVIYTPNRKEFVEKIIVELKILEDTVMADSYGSGGQDGPSANPAGNNGTEKMEVDENGEESEERKKVIRLCKTVMKWISSAVGQMFTTAPPELFKFLPTMCTLEKDPKDDELKTDCSMALACFSQALIQPENIPVAMETIKEVMGLSSWHARVSILGYMQVMVFCNFFNLHKSPYIEQIRGFVFHLICDDQLEVREMAAITLSGLLHCGFLQMNQEMLNHFELLSKNRVKKKRGQRQENNISLEALIKRHAGVLGLSAFVQAYPYDVPQFVPQILMDLSDHVNDPQPIQMTVKKTLSNFRRTHHDNWHDHKQMFTDDQLVILTDLLVSPTYYA